MANITVPMEQVFNQLIQQYIKQICEEESAKAIERATNVIKKRLERELPGVVKQAVHITTRTDDYGNEFNVTMRFNKAALDAKK